MRLNMPEHVEASNMFHRLSNTTNTTSDLWASLPCRPTTQSSCALQGFLRHAPTTVFGLAQKEWTVDDFSFQYVHM